MRGIYPAAEFLLKGEPPASLRELFFPEENRSRPEGVVEELLAEYLWDFQVCPAEKGVVKVPAAPVSYGESLPPLLEIRFNIMAPQAGEKLKRLEVRETTWNEPESPLYRAVILPHRQTFCGRVHPFAAGKP